MNLTSKEEVVAEFSNEEETEDSSLVEWTLLGKVLSPSLIHVNTIRTAMKPAWGNPQGLKFHAIRGKGDNKFVAEFGGKMDLECALAGTPWMVGRHAIVLQEYGEWLCASEIVFENMEIRVRILNLPLGWMNLARGTHSMSLIGQVVKMHVDIDGKASEVFLCARVDLDIDKPLRHGVRLRMNKNEES